jgi:hypothetical protein
MPGLPKLLLSCTDLVNLHLDDIPITGFFSPEAIVTGLSALTRLKVFHLKPKFDRPHPDWENRRFSLPTRAVLPSLAVLEFKGVNEYLEDFIARIDAPLLDHLAITFEYFHVEPELALVPDAQQLFWFISRAPKLQAPVKAHIGMESLLELSINFLWPTQISSVVRLRIQCVKPEWQFPCLAQFCRSPLFPLPTLEELYISHGFFALRDGRITQWLELFQPFTSVKNLYLSKDYEPLLKKLVGERATEVFPTLENVFLERFWPSKPVRDATGRDATGQFIAARQLAGRPIVVSRWDSPRRRIFVS